MFGINSVNQVGQIITGHYNEITNKENELYEYRIRICRDCKLYSINTLGEVCDSKKCTDMEESELVTYPSKGKICGCGCRLEAKTRVKGSKCVLGKW